MECQLERIDLHYESRGDGHPILMLHGFGPDHRLMTGCLEPVFRARTGWKRVYLDLPGMGRTPGEAWITNSDDMLEVILDFIDAVVSGERLVLVGESYGGYLARGVIQRRPELVDGLLLICPVVVAEHQRRTVPPHVTLVRDPTLATTLTQDELERFQAYAVVESARTWERTRDEVGVGFEVADEAFMARLERGYAFTFDVDTLTEPFDRPTLILTGRQDCVVGYRDAWGMMEGYPRATFAVLDRAGHNAQIEQEVLFEALANEWLGRVEDSLGW